MIRPATIHEFLDDAGGANPERPFVLTDGAGHTYAAVIEMSRRVARGLRDLGVSRGDRVALMLPNGLEFLVLWFGASRVGASIVPINTAYRSDETRNLIRHARPRVLGITRPLLEQGGGMDAMAAEWQGHVVLVEPATWADSEHPAALPERPESHCVTVQDLLSAPELAASPQVNEDDVAVVIYTSGSTGLPKGVLQTHRTYVLTGQAFPWWLGLGEADRLLTPLPLFHINAQAYSVMGAIGAGASVALLPRFSASTFWCQVRETGATQFNALGAIATILLKQPPGSLDRAHSARLCYLSPALPPDLHRRFEERFGVRVMVGYGMSECTFGTITALDGSSPLGSMGKPRHHPDSRGRSEVALVRDDGTRCAPCEIGEIVLRGPTVMLGYLDDEEHTNEVLRDGWLYSGDLACRDEDDNYFFVDRKKEIIRRRGENVAPADVEVVLTRHPAVQEVAVVPAPSELTDEEIVAFVVLAPEEAADESALQSWCADHLATFKIPQRILFVDALPLTASGKVAKQQLKAQLVGRAGGATEEP